MGIEKYILDGHTPVVENDLLKWGRWFETAKRHVAKHEINGLGVSTVFLGLDHNWNDEGVPILFETMIFGMDDEEYQERYATWEEAEKGHEIACEIARAYKPKEPKQMMTQKRCLNCQCENRYNPTDDIESCPVYGNIAF